MASPDTPIDVACPRCGQKSLKPISELVAHDAVPCDYCGFVIDISTKEWRAIIDEAADSLRHIEIIRPKAK